MKIGRTTLGFLVSLRGRLMVGLVVMALTPALLISWLSYENATNSIEMRLHEGLNNVADLKQTEISRWISLVQSDTRLLADNFLNEEHITVLLDPDADPELQAALANFLTENLVSLQAAREGYEEILYVNRQGRVLLSTSQSRVGTDLEEFEAVQGTFASPDGVYIQDVHWQENQLEMTFGQVMHHVEIEEMLTTELVNAAVLIRVDLSQSLYPIIQNWPAKGETGDTFIIEERDGLHYHLSPLRFSPSLPLVIPFPQHEQDPMLHGNMPTTRGQILEQVGYRGEEVLRAYREIPEMGWGFVIDQDRSEAFAPVRALTITLVLATLGILLTAFGAAVWLARTLTVPLNDLAEGAKRVAAGDFETEVKVRRPDEVGELADAFNRMVDAVTEHAQTIQQHSEELQALVNLSASFLQSADVIEALENALREAISATRAQAGAAVLLSADGQEIITRAVVGLPEVLIGSRNPLNSLTAPGYTILHRKGIRSTQLEKEERFRVPPIIHEIGVKSSMTTPLQIGERVIGALVFDSFVEHEFGVEERSFAQTIANQTAVALERIQLLQDLSDSYDRTLSALVAALDARDKETEGHSQRVVAFTRELAGRMGLNGADMEEIARGALLHDIGKIGVPDAILHKPGKLTREEWEVIRRHPEWGKQILVGIPFLRGSADLVFAHHERWDGKGYPTGLKGKEIPIGARIFGVVDAFDAITSSRPYRKASRYKHAQAEIIAGRGSQFDPDVVDAFLLFSEEDWLKIRQQAEGMEEPSLTNQNREFMQSRASNTGKLEALNLVMPAFNKSLDVGEVLNSSVRAIVDLTRAAAVGVFLIDAEKERLAFATDQGLPEELKQQLDNLHLADIPQLDTIKLEGSELYADLTHNPIEALRDIQRLMPDWQSTILTPLLANDQTIGLMLLFSEAPVAFDAEDQHLFDQVGKQLGQAIFNARLHEKVKVQAITDNLTGAYNRHYLDDFLNIELKRSQRYKRAMAVAMLDMDHFKQCNDDGGHLSGDRALREAVKLMSLGVRSVDLVARFGGEEFVIVMPETDAQGALEVAQRLRALIEGHDFPCGKLTASIGVASWDFSNGSGPTSAEEMLAQADQALFMAKQAGRNLVMAWQNSGA